VMDTIYFSELVNEVYTTFFAKLEYFGKATVRPIFL
jgi:hypothetical protein